MRHGKESDDLETRKDKEKLDDYVSQLIARGYVAEGRLGFKNRAKEIVRIVKEANADMLEEFLSEDFVEHNPFPGLPYRHGTEANPGTHV